jgi:hypothetical protein
MIPFCHRPSELSRFGNPLKKSRFHCEIFAPDVSA